MLGLSGSRVLGQREVGGVGVWPRDTNTFVLFCMYVILRLQVKKCKKEKIIILTSFYPNQ